MIMPARQSLQMQYLSPEKPRAGQEQGLKRIMSASSNNSAMLRIGMMKN
jgi:hypothetical protein